jgi:hypothetical protein
MDRAMADTARRQSIHHYLPHPGETSRRRVRFSLHFPAGETKMSQSIADKARSIWSSMDDNERDLVKAGLLLQAFLVCLSLLPVRIHKFDAVLKDSHPVES